MTLLQAAPQNGSSTTTSTVLRRIDAMAPAASRGLTIDIRAIDRAAAVSHRVRELRELPDDWAGPGTKPVSIIIAGRVSEAYAIFASLGYPVPSVVPAVDGTVQLEWHTDRCDLEVDVAHDVVDVYFHDLLTGRDR